jgi:hypothetical protein
MSLTRITTYLKVAALAAFLISAMQIPPALASNYELRGAICKNGGNPSISLENQDGKFILQLSTGGGKGQVGLVINGLEKNPITVKDLDKIPITAVFEINDKKVLRYTRTLIFKMIVRNDDGKLLSPAVFCDTDVNRGGIPLRPLGGDVYSATFPAKILIDLGKEVLRLRLSENSKVVGCVIYLDGAAFGFDETNRSVVVSSISVAGQKLGVKLENILGCEAFPNIIIIQ